MTEPHLCPKCNGHGIVNMPPWVAGDVHDWDANNTAAYTCNVCGGAGVLWR